MWCVVIGVALLRMVYLPWINLFPEEAYYWNYAQHLDFGYLDHPPMVAWLIAAGTRLFGQTEFGVRLLALVCSLVTSFFAYCLAELLYGRRVAATATLLVQVLPFFFMVGWIMTPDAPLTACWAGTLYWLAQRFFEHKTKAWLGVGVCLGLGMLSKYTIALLAPATLLFLVLDPSSRAWWRHAAPYQGALVALAIFSPVIVWNANHHWASFAFQSTGRLQQHARFSLHALLGSVLLLLTPVGVILAGKTWVGPDAGDRHDAADRRRRMFAWVFTLVPLAVFVVFSLTHRVKLNWTGPLWLALVPALAAQIDGVAAQPARRALSRAWLATVSVLTALYIGLLQYLSFGVPGLRPNKNIALLPVGWSQMGQELERQQADMRRQTSTRVLIVGMDKDFIASEAAFYHSNRPQSVGEVTGAHLFGSQSLMYAFWFPPAAQEGASLVLASFHREWLRGPEVRKHCAAMEAIQIHTITRYNQIVCSYYTRAIHGYNSHGFTLPAERQK